MSDPSARRAVVTISALYGTGSSVTGGRVAAALAVPFLDRDAANTPPRTGRADHGGSDVDAPRTLRQRATAALGRASTMSGEVGGDVERLDVDERGLRGRTEELLAGAAVAGGVAIGRGGMVVLRTVPWALHVFLGGPREGRVAAGMASAGLDRHTAADLQRREDQARISYVRRAYGVDGEDPLLYHLMLDAVALGADTCVELIVTAARRRLANPQPTPRSEDQSVRWTRYLGYAGGDAANNLTFALVSAFLLIYYTDVAGIPASTAGTLFLVVRIWGGVTDLLAGQLVDRTATRWGKFRPYLVAASVPLLVLLVLLFSIPGGFGGGAKVVWAYATYMLFSLAYSFVNIPYGSLAASMTQDSDERTKFSTARTMAASLTILVIAVVVSPQISGGGDLQRTLTITTIVFAVVGYLLYVGCFAVTQERSSAGSAASLRSTVTMVRHNRPLVVLCLATLVFLTGQFSLQTVAVYYARDVLGNADLYIVMTLVQTVAMIIAAAVIPFASSALGKKRVYIIAAAVGVAAGVGVALAPGSVPAVGIACFGLLGLGFGAMNTLTFAFQADTVEYGQWKSGTRAEASSYAVLSFTRKVGQAIGGAAAAYTIGLGGYVSGASDQTSGARWSIRIACGLLPAIGVGGAIVAMVAYPLTERAFRRIVEETAQRRATGDLPVRSASA